MSETAAYDLKAVHTTTLRTLNAKAVSRHYNRSLTDKAIKALDTDGFHILVPVVPLMDDGALHRCRVLMKTEGQDEPVEAWLDVAVDEYAPLHSAEQVNAALRKAIREQGEEPVA